MTLEQIEAIANDPELILYREELTKAEALKDALAKSRHDSAIARLRYDAALQGWSRLFNAYEDKLREAMR